MYIFFVVYALGHRFTVSLIEGRFSVDCRPIPAWEPEEDFYGVEAPVETIPFDADEWFRLTPEEEAERALDAAEQRAHRLAQPLPRLEVVSLFTSVTPVPDAYSEADFLRELEEEAAAVGWFV